MQVCDYLPGQNPWMAELGHWQVLLLSLAVAPTWTAQGPGLPPLSPAWLPPWALGLATSSEAQILKQLSGQLGPQGPWSRPLCMQLPEAGFPVFKTSRGPASFCIPSIALSELLCQILKVKKFCSFVFTDVCLPTPHPEPAPVSLCPRGSRSVLCVCPGGPHVGAGGDGTPAHPTPGLQVCRNPLGLSLNKLESKIPHETFSSKSIK